MAHLSLCLLGPFQVTLDGQSVTGFESNKVRALLAYLAVEADRPHRREVLAGLLWGDWPDRDALSNLRYALSNLRGAIGDRAQATGRDVEPPFLIITRDTLQFNTASDCWLDAAAFAKLTERDDLSGLEKAVDLYRGSFLEGFSIGDSPAFEEWALFTRERLARQMSSALHRLSAAYEQRGEYEPAQSYAWRQLEREPWDEAAHRRLMRALALGGRRSTALAQYETCRRLLAEELGVEPSEETTRLYKEIRDGKLQAPTPPPTFSPDLAASLPSFLETEPPSVEPPVFVAREPELAQLDRSLDLALAGQGRVVFVTGEAGSGKTTLVQEFIRRAQNAHAGLVAASGNCNAYGGIGDPYLPFREILELLTGDVEAKWAAGAMSGEHARRLWNTLPLVVQTLVEVGPDLIDTFVPCTGLLDRATARAQGSGNDGWLTRLRALVECKPNHMEVPSSQQSDLFKQYTRVLKALAQKMPVVLALDNLQWADAGSIHLLFHLGRQLAGSRILIVGTYRPEDVALGRDGARHPLEAVVNEFQRDFGDITVALDQAGGREFVEALLDSEPNRLGTAFRERLYRQTRGHPLFTIELLQGLREGGQLVRDAEGCWVEATAMDWKKLPARVEAVIAERIGRLAQPLQGALRVASVEGEVFTAEVVARVRAADGGELVGRLSAELDRKHRLVRAHDMLRMGSQRLSRYRFRHILFQKYLYNSLDEVERLHLHEAVGNTLEALYAGREEMTAAIAPQLAWHFQEAGIAKKAIHYLHQAGERSLHMSAYHEGIAHLSRGLEMLKALPEPEAKDERLERAQQELALQLALGLAWRGTKGYGPEAERAYTRARELGRQTGDTSQLCQVLGKLSILHFVRAEHQEARDIAEEALNLAQQADDPLHIALGHWYLGTVSLAQGEYTAARGHLERIIVFYDPQQHRSLVRLRGSDAGLCALAYDACCLWCLGYPDQARKQAQETLALARHLGHPMSLAEVLYYAGCLFNRLRRDGQALKADAEELIRLSGEKAPVWSGEGASVMGEALIMLGRVQEGMAQLREGLGAYRPLGGLRHLPGRLCSLAEAQAKSGRPGEALDTLAEALALVEDTGERLWEVEVHRLTGELLLAQGDEAGAEGSLQEAIEVARRQQARSWELRATTSLARLWQANSRGSQARRVLGEVYEWFTEGFDTRDLKEARALLEELS